jgi:hypothetical protein
MAGSNYVAVVTATAAALVFSSARYTVFGKARMKLLDNDERATAGASLENTRWPQQRYCQQPVAFHPSSTPSREAGEGVRGGGKGDQNVGGEDRVGLHT